MWKVLNMEVSGLAVIGLFMMYLGLVINSMDGYLLWVDGTSLFHVGLFKSGIIYGLGAGCFMHWIYRDY